MPKTDWLVQKDDNGKWYFFRGKYAPKLVSEVAKENLGYLKFLIDNDAGTMPLECRNYISTLIKSTETRTSNG